MGSNEGGSGKEERARERQELRIEIERERERSMLRGIAGESLREGGLQWERAQERLASSSGPKALGTGEEMGAGEGAHGNREGEGDGRDNGLNAAEMPSILRRFELEQVRHLIMTVADGVRVRLLDTCNLFSSWASGIKRDRQPCFVQESFRKDMEALKLILGRVDA